MDRVGQGFGQEFGPDLGKSRGKGLDKGLGRAQAGFGQVSRQVGPGSRVQASARHQNMVIF